MPITVTCQACGQSFSLRDDLAGVSVRCRCGRPLTVPSSAQGVLGNLLDTELGRPVERLPERKAPVHKEEKTSASLPPTHSALGANPLSVTVAPPPEWVLTLRVVLRSVVGVVGICYGLVMLWLGAMVAWSFGILGMAGGITRMPWFDIVCLGVALCGVLLSVGSVGVLIGRKDAGPKVRFAAWTLVALWIGWSFLNVIVGVREAVDKGWDGFTIAFWQTTGVAFATQLTWGIVPFLIFLWCVLAAKRDLKAGG